jgi:hypothetical protein
MIDRRSLVVAGLCFGWQVIFHRTEAANGSPPVEADIDSCHDNADEIEAQVRGRIFTSSTERLSWGPLLSGN